MTSVKSKIVIAISFFLLFSAFSYTLLKKSLWDYDFWWHVSTGRYIIENASLPETDPFSFTSQLSENKNLSPKRESLILKQYWLAQILFYKVYSAAGAKGMIILRSMLLILMLAAVGWGLYRRKVRFYLIFALMYCVYLSMQPFTGERPVLFSLLFSVVTFVILDEYARNRGRTIYCLPPLMLLWSNMHGGFILGDVIIIMFMIGEFLNIRFKRTSYSQRDLKVFYSVAVLSLILSCLNPNGLDAFLIALSSKYGHFRQNIQEHQPPFMMYMKGLLSVNWGFVSMVLLFPVLMVRMKKASFSHVLLISGLLFKGLLALRFTIFYSSIGAIILGSHLQILIEQIFLRQASIRLDRKVTSVFIVAVLLSSLAYFAGVVHLKSFGFSTSNWYSVPKEGVDFVEEHRLPGNIFHDFGIGGYLAWRLYPWKKTFIDTRGLNYTVMYEYGSIGRARSSMRELMPVAFEGKHKNKNPLWKRLLNHYDINLIFMVPLDTAGEIPPLLFALADDDGWVPIYTDQLSVIYIRNSEENRGIIRKFRRPTEDVYNTVLLQASLRASHSRHNPRFLMSVGEIFYRMGKLGDAVTAYEYADRRMPGNNVIMERLQQIRSEMGTPL